MASLGWAEACPKGKEVKAYLVSTWIFRKDVPSNHDAGSGPTQTQGDTMRFYNQPHRFYCGIDLHARTMYLCILDPNGQPPSTRTSPPNPDAFLDALAPFRDGLVVAVECMFAWYWLADLCQEHSSPSSSATPCT